MRRSLLVLFIIAFLSLGAGSIFYSVEPQDDAVIVNATILLRQESPVNFWRLTWLLPGQAELLSLSDREGPITNFSMSGESITFTTNSGALRKSEVVSIRIRVKDSIEQLAPGLERIRLSLAGFEGESTSVTIHSDRIASFSPELGYRILPLEENLTYVGAGPVSFRVLLVDKRPYSEHFFLFGGNDLGKSEEYFFLLRSTLGFQVPYQRFSVLVVSDAEWNATEPKWSAGLYKGAGLIKLPRRSFNDSRFESIVLHEAAHGYNEFMMAWDRTNASWIDEGLAKFIEYEVNALQKTPQPNLFHGTITYREGDTRYTLKPRSTMAALRDYYDKNMSFMTEWFPDSRYDRAFGYAYSELMIRELVAERGIEGIYNLSRFLRQQDEPVASIEERTALISQVLPTTTPCRTAMNVTACVEDLNELAFSLPDLESVTVAAYLPPDQTVSLASEFEEIQREGQYSLLETILYRVHLFLLQLSGRVASLLQ